MSHNQAVGATHDEPKIEGLQPGAKLLRGQYEILRYLSNGGFGITYLARDSLERDVVIKECFPGALCRRNGDLVEPNDPSFKDDLRSIIDLFIQEARNHARLVHPNIVDVHQVFEDNDTAYIAMDLIRGCDLLDYVENPENDGGPDFIVQVTEKMLSAVSFIHQSGMLHRDISPDNILIDENGDPVLIDFGAAREQAANKSAALLTLRVIKDGYSPHEFYVRGADQGPSSDLYVLAATLYHAISGERPIDGQSRLNAFNNGQDDPYTPLTGRFEGYPDGFLEAIDKAMEVHATDRLQSALDWLRMFRGPGVMFDTFAYRPVSVIVGMDRKDKEEEKARIKAESENAEAVVTALLAGNSDIVLGNEDKKDGDLAKISKKEETPVAVDTVVQSGSGGSGKLIAGAAVVAVALAAGGFFVMSGDKTEDQAETPVAQPMADIQSAETEAPVTDPSVTEATDPEPEVVVAPEPKPEEPVEQAQPVPAEPAATETASVDTERSEIPAQSEEVTDIAAVSEIETPATDAIANAGVPAEQQVAFAHWDVDIPFQTSRRRGSTGATIAVTGVDANQDMSVIGDWVQRGAVIYTLNGSPVRQDVPFAAQVLDNLKVDADGYTRVAARYRPLGQTRAQNGLLALPAIRSVGLENGYTFTVSADGNSGWQTTVNAVPADAAVSLQKDDVLLNESHSGITFDGSESLDEMLAALVSSEQPEANLTVLRNGAETAAIMQLAQE
ncbi:serine/threonine-protein kinase [Ruegeria sp. HKCCE3926]|uniref:serine/threonine protein kinase n=1 Tax=Ruegeria sp. HKCCE3926 TaxID=2794831 RepID=UPI001AE10684|nr:serine/threonine-protein kinase [Ruegeria sp. HKCCE3926]